MNYYCDYLNQMVEEGDCYDIQMISDGYIKSSAMPDIKIDRRKAQKACEQCLHRMCQKSSEGQR